MNWIYLVVGIVLVLLLFAVLFAFASDPQEVDAEEAGSIRKEGAETRSQMLTREEAQAKSERERELKEERHYPGDDFN